ncbi:putative Intraflagellar transport protein 81 like protein [Blattamonas nauphoetae]|uniref:Intraflagellar transport protein 81 like protein n=1 Tax=Blattamonas nauphoetae TaxID=2049346 RepID=A0ABQ9XA50_9EUKA|nr:putative Intraflagellar transport protein 81 like protein [Blattamonas nauphoetae]
MNLSKIASRLNEPPFNRRISPVELDGQTDEQWLQLLVDICSVLGPEHKQDFHGGSEDDNVSAVAEFLLQTLAYKPDVDVDEFPSLLQSDRQMIQQTVQWLLANVDKHQRRVYLAKYLLKIKIPEYAFSQDPYLVELNQKYHEAMESFKEQHKAHTEATRDLPDLEPLQDELDELQREADALSDQVENMQRKVGTIPQVSRLLDVERDYREASAELSKNENRYEEQLYLTKQAEAQNKKLSQKVSVPVTDASSLLNSLQENVNELAQEVRTTFPNTLQEQESKLEELSSLLLMSHSDVKKKEEEYRREIEAIKMEISSLSETKPRKTEDMSGMDGYRMQALGVEKKRQEAHLEMERKKEEMNRLKKEIEGRRSRISPSKGAGTGMEEEFDALRARVREKALTHKAQKTQLDEIRGENSVLKRTSELLQERDSNVGELLDRLEEERGIKGHRGMTDMLVEVSKQKQEMDKQKEQLLTEHTRVVSEIQRTIADKKNILKPKTEELKALRKRNVDIKQERDQKKQKYDSVVVQLEGEQATTKQKVMELRKEMQALESELFELKLKGELLTIKKAKAGHDEQIQVVKEGTLRDAYTAKEKELRTQQQRLRETKKTVDQRFSQGMKQSELFRSVAALFKMKADVDASIRVATRKSNTASPRTFTDTSNRSNPSGSPGRQVSFPMMDDDADLLSGYGGGGQVDRMVLNGSD